MINRYKLTYVMPI